MSRPKELRTRSRSSRPGYLRVSRPLAPADHVSKVNVVESLTTFGCIGHPVLPQTYPATPEKSILHLGHRAEAFQGSTGYGTGTGVGTGYGTG